MEPVVLPVPVAEALAAWTDAHDEVAPGLIEGLYLVGSVALDDWTPHSDIDIVAVVADPSAGRRALQSPPDRCGFP